MDINRIRHKFWVVKGRCQANGVFTLAVTDTDTETDTDKMGLQPIYICIGVCVGQSEQFCIL